MQKILVVVDMQNDFIDGALGTKEAAAIVPLVENKINTFKGKVLFTRDTHNANYLETQEGRNLPVAHCIKDTDGWQICNGLKKYSQEDEVKTFDKAAFGSKELAEYLSLENDKNPIENITFVGLCTDICVISNAMLAKAFLPEVDVAVDASCCAGVTPESHNNALEAMRMCQIRIL